MELEEKIFKKKVPDYDKLPDYGFTKKNNTFIFKTLIMQGQFIVKVTVDASTNQVEGQVIDAETGDEYALVHANNQTGNFVGQVRTEYEKVLTDIAQKCFHSVPFSSSQANQIARFVTEKFSEQPDFPFKKFPDYGVFRNQVNNKWYGLIMNISKDKLTKDKKDKDIKIEILDLKVNPDLHEQLLKKHGFYPSYHMHKQSWITIVLDGEVANSEIYELLSISRKLSLGKAKDYSSAWLVPGNPKYYDIKGHFRVGTTTIWKQSTNIQVGDTVYLYVTAPIKAVKYKCEVREVNLPAEDQDKNENVQVTKIMKVKVLKEYEASFCPFSKLKELGIKAVRGPRRLTKTQVKYLG